MTMRCTIERNASVEGASEDTDGFGQLKEDWVFVAYVPCWAWSGSNSRKSTTNEYGIVSTDLPGIMFPLGTDVKEGDRISEIVNRRGVRMLPKTFVDHVDRRSTHLEATLRDNR